MLIEGRDDDDVDGDASKMDAIFLACPCSPTTSWSEVVDDDDTTDERSLMCEAMGCGVGGAMCVFRCVLGEVGLSDSEGFDDENEEGF